MNTDRETPLSEDAERNAGHILGALDYPMLIVTLVGTDGPSGCLVGFASQCSIHPPRLMVWLSKENHTYRVGADAATLVVHVLAADERALAEVFGETTGDVVDKFAAVEWHEGPDGVPILDGCRRWIVGSVLERVDTGDHVGFLLAPIAATAPGGEWPGQLAFRAVRDLSPGHPA